MWARASRACGDQAVCFDGRHGYTCRCAAGHVDVFGDGRQCRRITVDDHFTLRNHDRLQHFLATTEPMPFDRFAIVAEQKRPAWAQPIRFGWCLYELLVVGLWLMLQ